MTRELVEAADKGRGYEYAKNSYLLIEDEELEAIEVESNHMIEINSFVPRSQIDERFLDGPYYIGPSDPVGQEAFAVIREAMRGKAMVALGRVVLAKRERVIMLQPWEKGLMGTTLRYPYEVRNSKDYFYDIPDVKVAPDMLKLAEHILSSKEATFDPTLFVDRYEQAVLQLLEKKRQGMPAATVRPFVAPTTVVNLMDALRRSIAEDAKAAVGTTKKAEIAEERRRDRPQDLGEGKVHRHRERLHETDQERSDEGAGQRTQAADDDDDEQDRPEQRRHGGLRDQRGTGDDARKARERGARAEHEHEDLRHVVGIATMSGWVSAA